MAHAIVSIGYGAHKMCVRRSCCPKVTNGVIRFLAMMTVMDVCDDGSRFQE